MARVSLMKWNGESRHHGMWIMGPREKTPLTHMRRLTGVESMRSAELRTRNGTVVDAAIAEAHSLTRFNDVRFQGASTVLYRNAVSISTGFDGTPLEFDISEPKSGTAAEYLFVSGGGKLEKVDTAGAVTKWGIDPPSDGNWGVDAGTGESESETTVVAPQDTTIIPTDGTFTGGVTFQDSFSGEFQIITIETTGVESASGSAYCTPWNIQGTSQSAEI